MIGSLLVGDAERPPAAGGAPDLRYQIVEEILDLLEASCTDGPVILVLEDLHWADDSTLLAFRSMVRRLAHVRAADLRGDLVQGPAAGPAALVPLARLREPLGGGPLSPIGHRPAVA